MDRGFQIWPDQASNFAPKTDALYALASQLRSAGVPLDGIGFQSHFTTTWYPSRAEMTDTLRRFAALGLEVEITELDVATQDGSAAQLSKQADIYRDAASACWAVPACGRITVWGIDDGATWLGVAKHPLPFDENYQPKPAYAALRGVHSQTSR